jgi:peptide/nickel transport system ATP-binding protein
VSFTLEAGETPVTIQAQVLDLLADLPTRLGRATILITHDMGVTAGQAGRVHVMYAGRIAESAGTDRLFRGMRHPYTQSLLASVPRLNQDPAGQLPTIPGLPPDLTGPPADCRFRTRCPLARERRAREEPAMRSFGAGHVAACRFPLRQPLTAAPGAAAPPMAVPGAAGPPAEPRPIP